MSEEWKEGTEAHYRDPLYYDLTYDERHDDVFFYTDVAKRSGGAVLELGVGTGRVASELALAGVDVVGIDPMPEMMERARARFRHLPPEVARRIELRKGDLKRLRLRRKFSLVIAPFNVFMHLYTREDVEAALATVRHHLKPRGTFAFDVLMPMASELALNPAKFHRGKSFKHPLDKVRYGYSERFEYDSVSQVQTVTMRFLAKDEGHASFDVPLAHRQFFPAELEALLHYNGFRLESRWGGFAGEPFDGEADSQVVVARLR